MYYIGIDLGTSAVKLVLMEASGAIAKIVSKEYPLFFSTAWLVRTESDRLVRTGDGRLKGIAGRRG